MYVYYRIGTRTNKQKEKKKMKRKDLFAIRRIVREVNGITRISETKQPMHAHADIIDVWIDRELEEAKQHTFLVDLERVFCICKHRGNCVSKDGRGKREREEERKRGWLTGMRNDEASYRANEWLATAVPNKFSLSVQRMQLLRQYTFYLSTTHDIRTYGI